MAGTSKKGKTADVRHTCGDVECNERHKELKDQLDRTTKELNQKTKQLAELTGQLEERVRCPVCLEVPVSSPIYNCPAGHSLCSTCYKGPIYNCPMCRAKMNRNTSLLAVTVIENIEHACKFKGCEARTPLARVEEHRSSCSFKIVTCPAIKCKAKIAYNLVMGHMMYECENSFAKDNEQKFTEVEKSYIVQYTDKTETICDSSARADTFTWNGKYFFLIQNFQAKKCKNIYVQMLGSKEDCKKCKVSIAMKDKNDSCSVNFCDHPSSIDMDEGDKEDAGLIIRGKDMMKFCVPVAERPGRSKYGIKLEFIDV